MQHNLIPSRTSTELSTRLAEICLEAIKNHDTKKLEELHKEQKEIINILQKRHKQVIGACTYGY